LFATGLVVLLTAGCATAPRSAPAPTSKAQQQALTPAQALTRLQEGNARFVEGAPLHRNWSQERSATAGAQYPFAVVLSCIDSRASSEIIFDQGLGEIFNARIAGNVLNDDLLGSMEFACQLAGARLIAVVGHSRCGAVKGACSGAELGHLTGLLERIQPAVLEARKQSPGAETTSPVFVEKVAELNVRHVLNQVRTQSPVLRELIESGKVGLVGGIHDLETGKVQFFQP
jgi:carbonic anhydrase